MNIKNYLWILPFFAFILGYSTIQWLLSTNIISAPHLVGKHIHEIIPIVSHHKLNLRLIDQKEEADLPEGIILTQTPHPGATIKQNQSIFIVTTKKPAAIPTPTCIGKSIDILNRQLRDSGYQLRIYNITHSYPTGLCFAQSPEPGEPLEKNRLLLYISAGNNKPIIWPDFVNVSLEETENFLNTYNIKPYIINDSPYLNIYNSTIIEQRPLAGTLLTLDEKKPLSVQLRIQ